MLKIFLTYRGKDRTSVNLTLSPPCRLIFTVTYWSLLISFHLRLSRLSCILQIFHVFLCVCDVQLCTAISQKLFGVFFVVTLQDLSTEDGPYKYVVNIIFFLFLLVPTINRPVALFFTVVAFSVESRFSVILVFVSFILIYPEIWRSMSVLATLVACSLEEIAPVFLLFPDFSDWNFSLGFCLSGFLFPPNYVFQNQQIYYLGLCMPSLKCWHSKIFSLVYKLRSGN